MNYGISAIQYIVRQTVYRMLPYAVVSDDGWGRYDVISDALDAGHSWIKVKAGDYPVSTLFTMSQSDVRIEGAGRATRVRATGATGCLSVTGARNWIGHMSFENLPGGGGGGADSVSVTGVDNTFFACWGRDADDVGFYSNSARNRFIACTVEDGDGHAIYFDSSGDNGLAVGNHLKAVGGVAITNAADSENSDVVGNIGDDAFTDASGTSTFTGNEEY